MSVQQSGHLIHTALEVGMHVEEGRSSHRPGGPCLVERDLAGVRVLTDPALLDDQGILVAFTMRHGGVSAAPFDSLDLASHVGDDPGSVDANRTRLLAALGLGSTRDRLVNAEQVHGEHIALVGEAQAGAGAFAERGTPPMPATDAMLTATTGLPLLMLFADCVPVVLVATGPKRAVAVAHAGWKGALARLPGKAAVQLCQEAGCTPSDLRVYVGSHICAEHYQVPAERLSLFVDAFDSMAAARGRLDLGTVVSESLKEVGVPHSNVCCAEICTAEHTQDFFSFRAEGATGRHGALGVILERS